MIKRKQTGFTLVEIAIVMILFGLLMGGIFKGQEMVTQAKIKNIIADYSGISAAYAGYQDRYRKVPGDDPFAGQRWAGSTPGNGDGQVSGKYNSQNPSDESRLWWAHLRRSGFVSGAGTLQPFNAVTGMIGVQTGDGASPSGPVLGGFGSLLVCMAGVPDNIAIAIDTQMDDGLPGTGTVRSQLQTAPNPDVGNTTAPAYVENAGNLYTVCRGV